MSLHKSVIVLFLISYISASSIEELIFSNSFKAGFSASITNVSNETKMPILYNNISCGEFNDGRDFGYQLGAILNVVHQDYNYFPFAGIFFESRPAYLVKEIDDMEVFDERLNAYVPLIREYNFYSSLKYISLELGAGWLPIKKYPLGVSLSFDFAYPFLNSSFEKKETLVSPEGLRFPNGSESRIYESGEIPDISLSFGVVAGVFADYEWRDLTLRPKLSYRYGLNSLSSSFNWNANTFALSLSVLWDFDLNNNEEGNKDTFPIIEEPEKEEIPVIVEKKKSIIKSSKDFLRYVQTIPLTITETIVTQTYPLLPYVFFDSASFNLKEQYFDEKTNYEFFEDSLPKNTMGIYYKMLDIVGFRMKKEPKSTLTLLGLTDGKELALLPDRIKLAKERANSIKQYIITKWNIEVERISIKTQDYPNLPTSEIYTEGFEENRRVELIASTFTLLRPVIHSKFIENSSNQKEINIYAGVQDEDAIKSYEINFFKDEKEIYSYHTNDVSKDEYKIQLNRMILDRLAEFAEKKDTLDVELKLYLKSNEVYSKKAKFPVNKSLSQFELGRLNLIVFDFDKSDISQENRFMIDNFVKSSIQNISKVNIIGSSDLLGGEDYNVELSQRRADNTMEYLLEFEKSLEVIKSRGIGSSNLLYDNAKPEGRFYCRTVLIEVITPLNK